MGESSKEIVIALDVMGGDNAPFSVLSGANIFAKKHKDVRFILFGDSFLIKRELTSYPDLSKQSDIQHSGYVIAADEKPSVALRRGKRSSMRMALDAVSEGKAQAMVSAGNTGALMVMAKLVLRPLPGIDRPAITSVMPTKRGKSVMLDLGANIDCTADNLVQFAVMGDAFAKVVMGLTAPTVGLLNVGSEDIKGSDAVKAAAEELKAGEYPINFQGFVEGDGISEGKTDVIVTDGFTGNIALKTAEGTANICADFIRSAFKRNPLAMLGGLLAKSALKKSFKQLDPRLYNGAMFLGLNGIAVKSHGGTDDTGFSNAIIVAHKLAKNEINKRIIAELSLDGEDDEDDDLLPDDEAPKEGEVL